MEAIYDSEDLKCFEICGGGKICGNDVCRGNLIFFYSSMNYNLKSVIKFDSLMNKRFSKRIFFKDMRWDRYTVEALQMKRNFT